MFWLIFFSLITSLWLLHYLYVTFVSFKYWDRRGIPNEKPSYPLGNFTISQIVSSPFHRVLEDTYEKIKGPFAGFMLHTFPVLVLKDPEIINRILVKDFNHFHSRLDIDYTHDPFFGSLFILTGDKWRAFKRKLGPFFALKHIRSVFCTIEKKYQDLEEYFEVNKCIGESFDIYPVMSRYAAQITVSNLMGIDVDYLNNPKDDIRLMTKEAVSPSFRTILSFIIAFLMPEIKSKIKLHFFRSDIENFVVRLVTSVMRFGSLNHNACPEFIRELLELKEDNPPELLSANVFVFVLAAYEAAGGMISYCLWDLAKNPEVQAKAQEVVDKVMEKHEEITPEALGEMSFIDNCISESLRLHPHLPIVIRRCNQDYYYEKHNLLIEKNSYIAIPTPGLHMDERYYPEAIKFNPDRFLSEVKAKRPSGTYLPFGDGQRSCLGKEFGKLIIKYTVVSLLRKYTFKLGEKSHKEELRMMPLTPLLHPVGGCHLIFKKR